MNPSSGKKPSSSKKKPARQAAERRNYHSPIREQQSALTRERIIAAGSELVHGFSEWNWKNLTFRAVSERAGVSERTVHRYFPSEQKLSDAILQNLVEESGINLEDLKLSSFAETTAGVFSYLSSFAIAPTTTDPLLAPMDEYRRNILLGTVTREAADWSDEERKIVAAMLDMLWDVPPYHRLIATWGFDANRAIDAITWVINLIEEAVKQGRRPTIKNSD